MVLDVTKVLVNIAGESLKETVNDVAVDVILRTVVVNALLSPVEKDTGMKKMEKEELARKIYQNDSVDLTIEQVKLIKDRIGEMYAPIVVGQCWRLLEGR